MSDIKWKGNEVKQKIIYGNDYHKRRVRDAKDRHCKVKRAKHCTNIFSCVDCPFYPLNYVLVNTAQWNTSDKGYSLQTKVTLEFKQAVKVIFNFYHCKIHFPLFSYFFFDFV